MTKFERWFEDIGTLGRWAFCLFVLWVFYAIAANSIENARELCNDIYDNPADVRACMDHELEEREYRGQ
jgi:hypothetical protein